MREILFRGKCIDGSGWVEGFYREYKMPLCWQHEAQQDGINYFIDEKDSNTSNYVLPETVGQYTGLKDSNGKRIFEGDILKEKCHNILFLVEWSDESLCYFIKTLKGGRDYLCDIWDRDVIGNRWDNPELLEVQS